MAEHIQRIKLSPSARIFYGIIGVIGELLITAAIFIGMFAVWQLYYTSYKVEGPRLERIAQFAEQHAPPTVKVGEKRTDEPPSVGKPGWNEEYAVLHVPLWDYMRISVTEGIDDGSLAQANATHYEDTAQPGELGNYSVAAHRRTYGDNFRWIDRLKDGDQVVVESPENYYVYTMKWHEIVDAEAEDNHRVIAPVIDDVTRTKIPTERWMTMTTCHPEWSNYERYITHLKFEYWTPKSTGIPEALKDAPYYQDQAKEQ